MSTISAPYGMRPAWHLGGGTIRSIAFDGGIASTYNTSLGEGDAVNLVTSGTFASSAAGTLIDGVFHRVQYTNSAGDVVVGQYWPASTTATNITCWVYIDKQIVYQIQSNGSIAITARGDCADIIVGTVNTKSGNSTTQISSTLVGAGNSAQLKIIGAPQGTNNAWGDTYTEVWAIINEQGLGFIPGNAV